MLWIRQSELFPETEMKFKIERVPLPDDAHIYPQTPGRGGQPEKYPWLEMRPGDSIWVPLSRSTVLNALRVWLARHPEEHWRYAAKDERNGTRVWRLES